MRSSNVQSLQMKLVNNCCIVGFSKITQAKNFGEKHIVSGDKKNMKYNFSYLKKIKQVIKVNHQLKKTSNKFDIVR